MIEFSTEFDIEQHLNQFKKKKFYVNSLADVEKVLTSVEYSQFINSVYSYYNSNEIFEGRLNPKHYYNAGEVIDSFWKSLIGNDLLQKFNGNLKRKLKI